MPPSHPLTLKERLRTSDLAGVAMIDRCHCEQSEFFGRHASSKRQPAAIAESEDWTMALVAAGVGIAIVPEGVARANPDVAVREIEVDVKREVGLAYSAARPPSEVLQNFIARLQSQRPKAGRAKRLGSAVMRASPDTARKSRQVSANEKRLNEHDAQCDNPCESGQYVDRTTPCEQRARGCSGDRHANGCRKGDPDQGHPGQSPSLRSQLDQTD